jgi:hypothetical protein
VSFDDADWAAPGSGPFPGGVVWLSWHFRVPAELRGSDLVLRLGREAPANLVHCNGARIEGGFGDGGEAVFVIPSRLARAGADNVIAVEVADEAGWAALRAGRFSWDTLATELPRIAERAIATSRDLERRLGADGYPAVNFILRGLTSGRLTYEFASQRSGEEAWTIAEAWQRLREIAADPAHYLHDWQLFARGEFVEFMRDAEAYQVPDFHGEDLQRPVMGSELSDFGSGYDIAYAGGLNRFMIGSVRQGVGPTHEFFNTARDVGRIELFVQTGSGAIVDGGGRDTSVAWYPYGWRTTTRQDGLEIEARTFFTGFDTIAIAGRITNAGAAEVRVAPGILVAARSNYDGRTDGRVSGRVVPGRRLELRNVRAGSGTDLALYGDTLAVGGTLPDWQAGFVARMWRAGGGNGLREALRQPREARLEASEGSAVLMSRAQALAPGASIDFAWLVSADADGATAAAACDAGVRKFSPSPRRAIAEVEADWGGFLGGLPRLDHPSYAEAKLYYAAATALRKNRYRYAVGGQSFDASFPARGGFNYFYQSDSCWNLLGYLDFNPAWAEGHAVPILVPPCEIMDPHFFWSMWELYSRLPDPAERRALAVRIYPLLKEAYRVWTTEIDRDGDLLVATPDNWDDNPRYDLVFKEVKYAPGWNSWWNDLVRSCRDNALDDPAPSSQLGYGAVVMERLARALGKDDEAGQWARQVQRHVRAVDSLWDEKRGYWIVTYRGTERDDVLTSSIIYPIFTDLCRDPAKIRRVIETHLLNAREFDGRFPMPTVAYDSERYYRQKPPFQDVGGGLWRGNLWMPEAWIVAKGLFKYGYEPEARRLAQRWVDMMAHQGGSVGAHPQFSFSPAEWYDSRTGLAQNNRAFSWSSAVALDLLTGNYQNERVVGAIPERDRVIRGHVREVYDFRSGRSLFRVESGKTVFPVLNMSAQDGQPIEASGRVGFHFSDPEGNFRSMAVDHFVATTVAFAFDESRWRVRDAKGGAGLLRGPDGWYSADIGRQFVLERVAEPAGAAGGR